MHKLFPVLTLAASAFAAHALVNEVRAALAENDFRQAEAVVEAYRKQNGVTPEMLEAHSWLGRGALAAKNYAGAESYAQKTYAMCLGVLGHRPLDQEPSLPKALGASIEVQAGVMAARHERASAVDFLRRELKTWYATSLRTRIQKNLNLLTLEGKPAPEIATAIFVGQRPPTLAQLRGKPVLLFFWAHWCGDCKAEIPVLERIRKEYGNRIAMVGPTQRYGFVARGEEAAPAAELKYIDQVRLEYYAPRISGFQVPVSEEAFRDYGASTTPTMVLVDSAGVVRLYHPGNLSFEELRPLLDRYCPVRSAHNSDRSEVTF